MHLWDRKVFSKLHTWCFFCLCFFRVVLQTLPGLKSEPHHVLTRGSVVSSLHCRFITRDYTLVGCNVWQKYFAAHRSNCVRALQCTAVHCSGEGRCTSRSIRPAAVMIPRVAHRQSGTSLRKEILLGLTVVFVFWQKYWRQVWWIYFVVKSLYKVQQEEH